MNKRIVFPLFLVFLISSIFAVSGCTSASKNRGDHHHHHGMKAADDVRFSDRANAVEQDSDNGMYRVNLFSNVKPIPLSKIHTWTINVKTPDGKAVEDARVFVTGGMPAHRHDFPTKPRVSKHLGNGDYRVEGIKFSMIGRWQIRFSINQGLRKKDRVIFDIDR